MKIVFFDGFCSLCNKFVTFIIKFDKRKKLFFSPLQGEFIKQTKAKNFSNQKTIVFLKEDQIFVKSRAIIEILASLGKSWIFVKLFLVIPYFIRDFFYSYIANNRYSWFGTTKECKITKQEENNRFLE